MKFRSFSIMITLVAMLAVISYTPSRSWAAASTTRASTGIGDVVVASALSCPNISCPTGDTCSFQTLTGTASTFTRFGAALSKANVVACLVINTTVTSANGNNGTPSPGGDAVCSPASGTAVITATGKSGQAVNIAFAGEACTNAVPLAAHKTLVDTAYVITASTTTGVSTGQGSLTMAFDSVLKAGAFSFSGTTN
jgi:hypothetical protein